MSSLEIVTIETPPATPKNVPAAATYLAPTPVELRPNEGGNIEVEPSVATGLQCLTSYIEPPGKSNFCCRCKHI